MQFSKNQWLSSEQIKEIQTEKLRRLIIHAYTNVPFYKTTFDTLRIKPKDIHNLEDLHKLPIIGKKDFQRAGISKTSALNKKELDYYLDSTSGSTGEPFQFYSEYTDRDIGTATTLLGYEWTGYKIGEKLVSLWGYHDADIPTKIYKYLLS